MKNLFTIALIIVAGTSLAGCRMTPLEGGITGVAIAAPLAYMLGNSIGNDKGYQQGYEQGYNRGTQERPTYYVPQPRQRCVPYTGYGGHTYMDCR